jgi:hypothetical protein
MLPLSHVAVTIGRAHRASAPERQFALPDPPVVSTKLMDPWHLPPG